MNIDKQPSTYETGETPRSFCCPTGEKGMVDYAFNTLKVTKIICDIRPINKSSIAVAKRIGMVETGMFVKNYRGIEMPHYIR